MSTLNSFNVEYTLLLGSDKLLTKWKLNPKDVMTDNTILFFTISLLKSTCPLIDFSRLCLRSLISSAVFFLSYWTSFISDFLFLFC